MSHTNAQLKAIINDHFAKQGKRLTNLSKRVNFQLLEIIEKYNIPLPEPEKSEKKKKYEKKKSENKEKLDTTMHPFRLGKFEYDYQFDDDGQSGDGYGIGTFVYEITKITKCFVEISYVDRNEYQQKQKCKINYDELFGWYFMEPNAFYHKRRIHFTKYTESIEERQERREFELAICKCRKVWNAYHTHS